MSESASIKDLKGKGKAVSEELEEEVIEDEQAESQEAESSLSNAATGPPRSVRAIYNRHKLMS